MTTQPTIQQLLTFASLQMAAEARLPITDGSAPSRALLEDALILGNQRASVFTSTQAREFASNWDVVAQRSTETGFSGAVFQNRQTGELVVSLRSTEFIDDFARDNKATNELEISQHGFAFGQLRDMERWFAELNTSGGALAGRSFSVTGYSLGGHLATAFNMMHGGELMLDGSQRVRQVVTFNGAGVGEVLPGNSLSGVVQRFEALSTNANGQAFRFSDPTIDAIYQRAHTVVVRGGDISAVDRHELERISTANAETDPTVSAQDRSDALTILRALSRIDTIRSARTYVNGLVSGTTGPGSQTPTDVWLDQMDQLSLDYQMAVRIHGADQGHSWTSRDGVAGFLNAASHRSALCRGAAVARGGTTAAARTQGRSGSSRSRRPVSTNNAFASAGATGGVPGSPTPPGARSLGTMWTSIAGVSASVVSG
jgi:hypothetical protein